MYVRTKKGEIFDCYESEQMHKPIYYPKKSKTNGYIDYEDVYKKSNNLIDVLEVGDYVNGKKVIDTYTDYIFDYSEEFKVVRFSETDILHDVKHIKSIVTKEQFESCMYKVGE